MDGVQIGIKGGGSCGKTHWVVTVAREMTGVDDVILEMKREYVCAKFVRVLANRCCPL